MKLNLVGSQYEGRSSDAGSITCLNMYPEKVESPDGANEYILIGCPGQTVVPNWDMSATVTEAPRCLYTASWGEMYAVYGHYVYKMVSESNLAVLIGTMGSPGITTPVNAADNGTTICFVDGQSMYKVDRVNPIVLRQDLNDVNPSHIVFQGGYLIVNNTFLRPSQSNPPSNTQMFYSELYNANSWPASNFFTAEGSADPVTSLSKINDQIWAMGVQRYEIFQESGDPFTPFMRFDSTFTNTGIIAPYSACTMGSTLFWLGVNVTGGLTVFRNNGVDSQRISTHAEEYQLSKTLGAEDVQGWVYSREGHDFVLFTSKSLNLTIVWDNAEGRWHRRSRHNNITTKEDEYHPIYASSLKGTSYCLCRTGARVLKLDLDVYDDWDHQVIVREHSLPIVQDELMEIVHDKFSLQMETGYGSPDPGSLAYKPQATIYVSDDAGHTWSTGSDQPIGETGEYGKRVTWWRLGKARLRKYKLRISAPVRQVWIAAYIESTSLKKGK